MTNGDDKKEGRHPRKRIISGSFSMGEARKALEENITLINSTKNPVAWNLTAVGLALCDALDRVSRDLELIHRKLDVIKDELSSDQ